MRKVPVDPLPTLPLQSLAARSLNSPPVAINSLLLDLSAVPVARAAIGFGDVTPHFQFCQFDEHVIAVIPFVANHLLDATGMPSGLAFRRFPLHHLGYCDARLNH